MIIIPKRKWAFPLAYERSYNKTLRAYVARLTEAAESEIGDMQALMENRGVKFDSYEDDLTALLAKIGANLDKKVAETALRRKVMQMYRAVDAFNEDEFKAVIRDAVGAEDFVINEKWQSLARSVWVQENLDYIKSIRRQFLDRIRQDMGEMILNAQGKQLRAAQLSEMIQNIAHNSKNRADLIARDQIGKLNGRLTQYRQQAAGIGKYKWSTSRDERVRSSHREREGKIFSWDNPPPDGHPGIPIRCRCVAIPVIDTETLGIAQPVKVSESGSSEGAPAIMKTWKRIKGEHSVEWDVRRTNPKYWEGDKWQRNCQRCVSAFEARRRGYDVTAKPRGGLEDRLPYMADKKNGWTSVYKNPELIPCISNTGSNVKKKVEKVMSGFGDGARAIIRVQWRDGFGGHVFIAIQENGKTRFVDPQCGKMDVGDYFKWVKVKETYVMRIDNLEFTDHIELCCTSRR